MEDDREPIYRDVNEQHTSSGGWGVIIILIIIGIVALFNLLTNDIPPQEEKTVGIHNIEMVEKG